MDAGIIVDSRLAPADIHGLKAAEDDTAKARSKLEPVRNNHIM